MLDNTRDSSFLSRITLPPKNVQNASMATSSSLVGILSQVNEVQLTLDKSTGNAYIPLSTLWSPINYSNAQRDTSVLCVLCTKMKL